MALFLTGDSTDGVLEFSIAINVSEVTKGGVIISHACGNIVESSPAAADADASGDWDSGRDNLLYDLNLNF